MIAWAKWVAIVLSATLLMTTLLLVRARRNLTAGAALPVSLEMREPITAR